MYDHIMLKLVRKEVLDKKDNLDRHLIHQYSSKISDLIESKIYATVSKIHRLEEQENHRQKSI
jgi:hypothetical protein